MQVDWLSGIVQTPPELAPGYQSGRLLRLDPSGEVVSEWASRLNVTDDEGSASRSFSVWTPDRCRLQLSGNPVKLLQDHNAFGSCDALGLFLEAGQYVRQRVGLFPSPATWQSCEFSGPSWTRIDLTRSYRFASVTESLSWIRNVAGASRDRRGAATLYESGTAVFGEGSRRWSLTIYDKHTELTRRARKDRTIPPAVLEWSAGVVRFELRLRSLELAQLDPARLQALTGSTARAAALSIWSEYFGRLTLNGNATMTEADLIEQSLPAHLRVKLAGWRGGADLRAIMSRASFYRVRRELLAATGIDIAAPPPALVAPEPVQANAALDPAGWDPEPIASHLVEPRADLVRQYGLALNK